MNVESKVVNVEFSKKVGVPMRGKFRRMKFTAGIMGAMIVTGVLILSFIASPFLIWATTGVFEPFLALLFWAMAALQFVPMTLLLSLAELEYDIGRLEEDGENRK